MDGSQLRYAVVGAGSVVEHGVVPAFAHARANSKFSALISDDVERARKLCARHGVPVRGTMDRFETLIGDVDAVYLCTPAETHAELTERAARAGKHVICEKPLAATPADCERMIRACRTHDVKLMTAYPLRFDAIAQEIVTRVHRGDIGTPRFFSSSLSTHDLEGDGVWCGLSVSCINIARALFGAEPNQVFATSAPGAGDRHAGPDETVVAVLHFDDQRVASFTASADAADTSWFRIVGSEGTILAEPAYGLVEPLAYTMTTRQQSLSKRGRKADALGAGLQYFSACVLADRDIEPGVSGDAVDVRIVDALIASTKLGEAVALGEIASRASLSLAAAS